MAVLLDEFSEATAKEKAEANAAADRSGKEYEADILDPVCMFMFAVHVCNKCMDVCVTIYECMDVCVTIYVKSLLIRACVCSCVQYMYV